MLNSRDATLSPSMSSGTVPGPSPSSFPRPNDESAPAPDGLCQGSRRKYVFEGVGYLFSKAVS